MKLKESDLKNNLRVGSIVLVTNKTLNYFAEIGYVSYIHEKGGLYKCCLDKEGYETIYSELSFFESDIDDLSTEIVLIGDIKTCRSPISCLAEIKKKYPEYFL